MKPGIYLDHAAATPVDPSVLEAMQPYFSEEFGNPSSLHGPGQRAKRAVDTARQTIAKFLGVNGGEIVFTGSGTESDNLAILGVATAYQERGKHHITSAIEHEAVLEPMKYLEKTDHTVTYVPVDRDGVVRVDALKAALTEETIVVSIMTANNEIGTIQPIAEMAAAIQAVKKAWGRGPTDPPFLHTDACQAAGVLDLSPAELGADLITFNGSKIYGPKGVGVLYLRQGVSCAPQIWGGSHEKSRRAGTHNVPAIVGMGKAFELAQTQREANTKRLTTQRDQLLARLNESLSDLTLNGHPTQRLPNNLNLTIRGVEGEILLMELDNEKVYASAGSACTAGKNAPSHVLLALGLSRQQAHQALRISLGHTNTDEQLSIAAERIANVVKRIREISGTY